MFAPKALPFSYTKCNPKAKIQHLKGINIANSSLIRLADFFGNRYKTSIGFYFLLYKTKVSIEFYAMILGNVAPYTEIDTSIKATHYHLTNRHFVVSITQTNASKDTKLKIIAKREKIEKCV